MGLLNTGKILAGYKKVKTIMKLQTQLLGFSLQTEEIKNGIGAVNLNFSFFLFLAFRICQWKKDALIYALDLQLGTCAIPHV